MKGRAMLVVLAMAIGAVATTPRQAHAVGTFDGLFRAFDIGLNSGYAMAVGDLDGDGLPDMVVTNISSPYTVGVMVGIGFGEFGPRTGYGTALSGSDVRIADLNEDGNPDVIVADGPPESVGVAVLLGNGDGTLVAPSNFPCASAPRGLALGDLNGDTHLDVVTANGTSDNCSVLLGNGDGTFQPRTDYAEADAPMGVTLADFNADGRLDLAVVNEQYPCVVSVRLGQGGGVFGPRMERSLGGPPLSAFWVAAGDFNGDDRPDLVAGAFDSAAVLLGNGDGTFGSTTKFAAGLGSRVVVADLNADGFEDLAVSNTNLSVLLGIGDGTFAAKTDYSTPYSPTCVAIGDLKRDGIPDLAVIGNGIVGVLAGNGDGSFGTGLRFATGSAPRAIEMADFNDDGHLDVVTANSATGTNTVSIMLGSGSGSFAPRADFSSAGSTYDVAIGQLSGDAALDLVVANRSTGNVSVLPGNGAGSFGPRTEYPAGASPQSVAIGDLNQDGRSDLAVANGGTNATLSVLIGLAGGGFGPPVQIFNSSSPVSVEIADLTGDGLLDLVTAGISSGFGTLLRGNGDGTFQPYQTLVGINHSVAIGDLNLDAIPDLASGNSGNLVAIRLGTGGGTFATAVYVPMHAAFAVAIRDLDDDAVPDLATTGYNLLVMRHGNGDGTFGPEVLYGTGVGPGTSGVAIGDLNEDGRLDVASADIGDNTVTILLNAPGVVGVPQVSPTGGLQLGPSVPNPARSELSIRFELPRGDMASLRIFDCAGRAVATLLEGSQSAGVHVAKWDRVSRDGRIVPPGIYFYELRASGERIAKRLVVLR